MYNVPAGELVPNQENFSPRNPYIGPVTLVDFSIDPIVSKAGDSYNVITFDFRLDDGQDKGSVFTHIEWEVRDNNKDKITNQFKRIVHILSQYWPGEEKDEAFHDNIRQKLAANSFEEFQKNVIKILNHMKREGFLEKDTVEAKILGEVSSSGKYQLKFPGYVGFLKDERSPAPLRFSSREQQNNQRYLEAASATPTSTDDLGGFGASSSYDDGDSDSPFAEEVIF